MKNIKVLGTGCANCKTTLRLIEEAAQSAGVEVALEKVEELSEIMQYGVMSTPGVVLDGQVVHAGGIPSKEAIASWLTGAAPEAGCCSGDSSTSGKCCG
ncbi:thioredoxin family protein [Sedimenticola thiotaurini]|uniref:Glutaredoxin n=1 Tax=Sedimenticola thiotaurini TaxID=1543721 RepID=A0A0F7JUT7_9GAMM|nr:thioredoxin family protein [Sedimenticola thiotaurini]AKH19387.1 glutaredoxin [Sedimenticola thiotaurini]